MKTVGTGGGALCGRASLSRPDPPTRRYLTSPPPVYWMADRPLRRIRPSGLVGVILAMALSGSTVRAATGAIACSSSDLARLVPRLVSPKPARRRDREATPPVSVCCGFLCVGVFVVLLACLSLS